MRSRDPALSLVSVWQEKHDRRLLPPLGARRDEELVDDDLRAIDEVPVLRFPDDEPRGGLDTVAVLESQRCVLRERAVVNLEGCFRLRDRLQRRELRACLHVVQDRVAMAEGAALDVFARDAHGDTVLED